jgi:hypothetical protein
MVIQRREKKFQVTLNAQEIEAIASILNSHVFLIEKIEDRKSKEAWKVENKIAKTFLTLFKKVFKMKREPKYRMLTPAKRLEINAQVVKLYKSGLPMTTISKRLGVSYKTVRTALEHEANALNKANNVPQNSSDLLPIGILLFIALIFLPGCGDEIRLKKTEYLIQGQWLHCSEVAQESCGSTLVCGDLTYQCQANTPMRLR